MTLRNMPCCNSSKAFPSERMHPMILWPTQKLHPGIFLDTTVLVIAARGMALSVIRTLAMS
uniref:Uncharacterized protein n=1 Tax=Rhizophora mucronata TaxID=61149 RepID=A0A2P2NIR9_RHIMU